MRVFSSQKEVQDAIFILYPRLVDPYRLQGLLVHSLPDEAAIERCRKRLEGLSRA